MEKHSNYKETAVQCKTIRDKFLEEHKNWVMDGYEADDLRLKIREKDSRIKQLKFVVTTCNRIVYQLTHPEYVDL